MSKKKPAAISERESRFEAAISCLREVYVDLREENFSLRDDPERPAGGDPIHQQQLEQKVAKLVAEKNDLLVRLDTAQNNQAPGAQEDLLANLYVAGYHLHRALDVQAVLSSVKEILLNLVGAETFAIYLLDANGNTLTQVGDEHGSPPVARQIPLGEGIMGVVAKTGIAYFDEDRQAGDFHNPVACVPLKAEERLLGVIQIHRLFIQKVSLTQQDHELFTLLAETAGTAMLAALLRRRYLHPEDGKARAWGDLLQEAQMASDESPDSERGQA
jgi:hypothetical protein